MITRVPSHKSKSEEAGLIAKVNKLRDYAAMAVGSAQTLVASHELFAKEVERVLSKSIKRSSSWSGTVKLLGSTDIVSMGDRIRNHSNVLSQHVGLMQEKLRELTDHIDSLHRAKRKSYKWNKIWNWLVKAFCVFALVLAAAAVIVPFVGPAIAGAVFAGGTVVASALAALCKELTEDRQSYVEKYKDFHKFLMVVVPDQAVRAERYLTNLESCSRAQEISGKERVLKMKKVEANYAKSEWRRRRRVFNEALQNVQYGRLAVRCCAVHCVCLGFSAHSSAYFILTSRIGGRLYNRLLLSEALLTLANLLQSH